VGKLQALKRETVRQIYGSTDYTIELTCGHRIQIRKEQLQGPSRVRCHMCLDDSEHAKAPTRGVRQKVELHYRNREGYMERLACGHHVESKTAYADRVPKHRFCRECLP